jgi:hypothetical protein
VKLKPLRFSLIARTLAILLAAVLLAAGDPPNTNVSTSAVLLYVAPAAKPGGDGSATRPFCTLDGALTALAARTPQARAAPARVILRAGVYALSASLEMSEADGGTANAPVVWQAAGDGDVVISGGLQIDPSALHPIRDPAILARLPKPQNDAMSLFEIRMSELGKNTFPALEERSEWPELFWKDGQALPLSAWPNGVGYGGGFHAGKIVVAHGQAASKTSESASTMVFRPPTGGRTEIWKAAMEKYHEEAAIGGHWYWGWSDDFIAVKSISDTGEITMARSAKYGIGHNASLRIYNLMEEMDAPGEYSLQPAQKRILVLLPRDSGAQGGPLTLSWLGSPLIQADGCSHVRFQGIRFSFCRSDGVNLKHAEDIQFQRCIFSSLGGCGLDAEGTQIRVSDCQFSHIGTTGAAIDGGDRIHLIPAGNCVEYCEFSDFGRLKRTYQPGVSLNGVGSVVEHCLFHDAPHAAVLFAGNEHLICDNEIDDVMTETDDAGAIYAGRDWTTFGTVISGNWIHNNGGLAGIYLDDQLSGITVKNNLIEHMHIGILVGGGRYDTIEGNTISGCGTSISFDSRGTKHRNDRTLREELASIPATQEPWISRYPMVAKTLQDHPELPVGTRIIKNASDSFKKPRVGIRAP